ncbi:hypothetical protein Tco_1278549 [Tanacetum coccineum]
MLFDHEPLLIDYILRRQHKVDDQHHDMPLIYYMEGHTLHFGRREFSLIINFCFGTVSCDLNTSSELKFRNRVFPNKIGFIITNLDIIGVIEDEERFGNLSNDDAIYLCLLLALKVIFMGQLLTFKVDDILFRSTSDLRPTIAEYQSSWWIDNRVYFQEYVPRAPPIREQHSLFETYLSKLKKARKGGNIGFMVSSIGGTSDNSVLAHERNDRRAKLQFTDAFSCMTSDLCDSLNIIFADLIQQHNSDEDIAQLEEQKKKKRKEFMNSSHGNTILAKLAHAKRNQLGSSSEKINSKVSCVKIKKYCQRVNDPCTAKLLQNVKPWVKDISRVLHSMDIVWLSGDIERFLGQTGQLLLQKGMPLFYANEERYTTPLSEVDQIKHLP